jgi:hypothetical protein
MTGQIAIAITFVISLLFCVIDRQRRTDFLMLSYILMFYTTREADYHYPVSEYAKASQVKRFFSHELIPISTKLFLARIVILLLVVLVKYVRREKDTFRRALTQRLPWALFTLAWGLVFGLSQFFDQVPLFHTVHGQVFEEVLEASAVVLALLSIILFRIQVTASARDPGPPSQGMQACSPGRQCGLDTATRSLADSSKRVPVQSPIPSLLRFIVKTGMLGGLAPSPGHRPHETNTCDYPAHSGTQRRRQRQRPDSDQRGTGSR